MAHNATVAPIELNRRGLLRSLGAVTAVGLWPSTPGLAQGSAPMLRVSTRSLEVNRKAAKVFHVAGPNGRSGLLAKEGDRFKGDLLNETAEPLQMHWHGQVRAPNGQDRSRPGGGMISTGQSDPHDFELTPGTHWMHAHTLSEQQLLAAPMVTLEKDAGDVQDVIIMLHDFAFRTPQEILAELGGGDTHSGHGAQPPAQRRSAPNPHAGHGGMPHSMPGGGHMMGMTHANDVRYDAYLANDRTLDDPDVISVGKGSRVRLRIINGATATGFFIATPGLTTEVVAVDGVGCRPYSAASYPLAQGQRLDLIAQLPSAGGAFPVLAQVEDTQVLTGVILATNGATVAKQATSAATKSSMLDLSLDARLTATRPLAGKRADKSYMMMLGEEPGYRWTINGRVHGEHEPLQVRQGSRVEMTFMNPTSMMHPMHLHGHHFQVVGIGGRRFSGPVRDTVIVPAHMPVTVAFDAGLKGSWFLHCHHLYHMATGMMTELTVT